MASGRTNACARDSIKIEVVNFAKTSESTLSPNKGTSIFKYTCKGEILCVNFEIDNNPNLSKNSSLYAYGSGCYQYLFAIKVGELDVAITDYADSQYRSPAINVKALSIFDYSYAEEGKFIVNSSYRKQTNTTYKYNSICETIPKSNTIEILLKSVWPNPSTSPVDWSAKFKMIVYYK